MTAICQKLFGLPNTDCQANRRLAVRNLDKPAAKKK
jgi:hypothetical protein